LFIFWYHSPNFLDTPLIMRVPSFLFHNAIFYKQIQVWCSAKHIIFSAKQTLFSAWFTLQKNKNCNWRKRKTYSHKIIYWHYGFQNMFLI
jgi:hypothetical protein